MNRKIKFICPMHPEIQANSAGSCEKCGMDLEPETPTSSQPEDQNYALRFFVSFVLTIPVFLDAMVGILPASFSVKTQMLLSTLVVFWGGWPFFIRAWNSIKTSNPNMFTLIAIGTGSAYFFSSFVSFFPESLPESLKPSGNAPVYFEAAAVIITLVLLGQYLEQKARKKTGAAIEALLSLNPEKALRLKEDGTEELVPLCHIHVGDRIRIKPGEKIPVDGVILDGRSQLNESMLTGEPNPIHKKINDHVTGGTLNTTGSFVMKAERVGDDTLLAKIIHMVSEAQRSQAPVQKTVDKISRVFVPLVILTAVATFFIWMLIGKENNLALAVVNSISVLIIACPCALGLATPMSIMVGIGRAAEEGILIKNAIVLETFSKVRTVVFDKTGTLTQGTSKFDSLHVEPGVNRQEILQWVASLENKSEHPLAESIVAETKKQNLKLVEAQKFRSFPGKGIVGTIKGKTIVIGNESLFREKLTPLGSLPEKSKPFSQVGKSISFIAIQNKPVGFITFSESIKDSSYSAVQLLKSFGIETQIFTGDNKEAAKKMAQKLGIDSYVAGIQPTEKGKIIKELKASGRKVAMTGDGINDAPALAEADIGIAMGTGTDVAIESADITLVNGNLNGVVKAYQLSQKTIRNIKQNLLFAFGYNILGIPIAAGALYPFLGILLSPMIAGAAMSFSSVSIIWNSLRLRKIRL